MLCDLDAFVFADIAYNLHFGRRKGVRACWMYRWIRTGAMKDLVSLELPACLPTCLPSIRQSCLAEDATAGILAKDQET